MISRTNRLLLTSAVAAMLWPCAASAQLSDRAIVDIVRECRKIADIDARAACYDNIPVGRSSQPAQTPALAPAPSVAPRQSAPGGFGGNQLPQAREERDAEVSQITATVASVSESVPGQYLLTLEDGAQWRFVDAAPRSYDAPQRGSRVEISAAAMGSYLLQYQGQRGIRVRRVR